ncbi:MAG TPA: collagenase [Trinickia sp.]|jgi:microbial collagenase|nr:collagenase [Trinickia sp.]
MRLFANRAGIAALVLLLTTLTLTTHASGHAIAQQPALDNGNKVQAPSLLPMPRPPALLPRSREEWLYDLPPSGRLRPELMTPAMRRQYVEAHGHGSGASVDCHDMNALAAYHGAALAQYVANLPDSDCANQLFSVPPELAATIFAPQNVSALADRFVSESALYRSNDGALLNLTLFLRAAYYLANTGHIAAISPTVAATLRPAIMLLVAGRELFTPNDAATTTAGEVVTLITNMHDEAHYLDVLRERVARFTNSSTRPDAARALDDPNVGYGFTGILKVFFYSHYRDDALPQIEHNPSYATTLYAFVAANEPSLINDNRASYQLNQAAAEAFRFAMHPALLPTVRPMLKHALAHSTMTGPDRLIWLTAAQAVKSYDNANCSLYGTCGFEAPLADAILSKRYDCADGTVHLRTEELTSDEASQACALMETEAPYFHAMLHTNMTPVANDLNRTLEVVVFSSNAEYENYSPTLFGNDTNNGGIYIEGEPSSPGNQARFIAFEATWLRPQFEIWNLKHEYVHYLDGRFDMEGDFEQETQVPVVWWLEGLAEYISRENDDQESIDAAKTGQYRLTDVFGNTYGMDDYVNRAYRWGYMAVRFMFERHPEVIATVLPLFRSGDYTGYWNYMRQLPVPLDTEFAAWVPTVTTAGVPPGNMPSARGRQ